MNKHTDFLLKLDSDTRLSIFQVLIKYRGNYDNNLSPSELRQYKCLKKWYKNTYSEDFKIISIK
jgi:hypothetical protein